MQTGQCRTRVVQLSHVQASLPGKSAGPLVTANGVQNKPYDGGKEHLREIQSHTVEQTANETLLPVFASKGNNEASEGHIQTKVTVKQPASAPIIILKKSPSTKHHVAMVHKRETLGDINGCGQQKQDAIEKKEKSITRTAANKENQPPEMSRVELSEATKIDDIRTKCIVTSNKLDQGRLGSTIAMGDEYCPAPPFNIGLDEIFGPSMVEDLARPAGMFDDCRQQNGYELKSVDIPGTSIDEGVLEVELSKQIIGASSGNVDMCPEAKGKTPVVIEIPNEGVLEVELSQQINGASRSIVDMCPEEKEKTLVVIEIPDDDLHWDLAEIDLACKEAEDLSPTNFQTPEKTCWKDGEVGSSSSSGEITNKFERRIIKPPACKRSPFVDYNENRLSHCTPVVNRMYAAVLLHARLSEEETGLEDKRYNAITTCLTLTIPFYLREGKKTNICCRQTPTKILGK